MGIALVFLSIVALMMSYFDWKLWPIIRRARRRVREIARCACPNVKVFSRQAASRQAPRPLTIWIATDTDEQRDRFLQDPSLYSQLSQALIDVGYPAHAVPRVRFVVQSQQTVNRDYGGSWREASEMP